MRNDDYSKYRKVTNGDVITFERITEGPLAFYAAHDSDGAYIAVFSNPNNNPATRFMDSGPCATEAQARAVSKRLGYYLQKV